MVVIVAAPGLKPAVKILRGEERGGEKERRAKAFFKTRERNPGKKFDGQERGVHKERRADGEVKGINREAHLRDTSPALILILESIVREASASLAPAPLFQADSPCFRSRLSASNRMILNPAFTAET